MSSKNFNSVAISPQDQPRKFLLSLFQAAVQRALPLHNTASFLPSPPSPESGGRTIVIGAGKAGGSMAQAVEALWPADAPLEGLVVTRYNHIPPRPVGLKSRIEIVEAAHPVPDAAGLAAAERILTMVQGLTEKDLVLCLISGGGSALLTLPADGLTLADKQRINKELLNSGANISEMNCLRKHLSRIKGGRLAAACAPARVVTLTISDVPGDDPSIIASGPTVPDATTCEDALAILQRYAIEVPDALRADLENGALETPKPGDPTFNGHEVHMIATPQQSLEAAADLARVFEAPCVILSGGETTVTVRAQPAGDDKKNRGRGGRAGEFCMGLALGLQGQAGVYALAADTDGIDGLEDNAGAYVAPDTLAKAQAVGMKIDRYLDRNDAYGYFEPLGDLVITGPTHTNVNDFRAILIL